MAKQLTRWKPDTCKCVIEFEWDDSVSEDERVHAGKNVVKACEAHPAEEAKTHHDKILEENRRKNLTLAELLDSLPAEHKVAKENERGEVSVDFKERPEWSFDAERNLVVTLPASAKGLKQALQASVTRQKVILE